MTKKKPELMSPVRNRASLEACKDYADAVYFSSSGFSLRAEANNIGLEELDQFVSACHKADVKAYLVVNSTVYNQELEALTHIMEKARQAAVDAVIVWDPAAIQAAKQNNLDFFVSTQANVSNWESAKFYKDQGAKRVILAREMTLEQIEEVNEKVHIETEAFIHGAMCLAISGRCILSGFFENKSANKGACNQLCRRKWKLKDEDGHTLETDGSYFLSAKDLCMIEHLPELIETGVNALKIEGRQRDNKYIRRTSRLYRRAIDCYFEDNFSHNKAKKWKSELKEVYNRDFTTGFYFGRPGKEGIRFDGSGSAGTHKKLQMGKVNHYYPEIKVAIIKLKHRDLKVGDRIIIEGENTYVEQEVTSLEIDDEKLQKASKGEEVGVKLDERVRENDLVFRFVE